jgi:putative ABC transport system permease protein
MGLIGGLAGGLLSFLAFNGMNTGTANWDTFSEIAFQFRVTPLLIAGGTLLAVFMAVAGGFLPAWRASRTTIAHALRGM